MIFIKWAVIYQHSENLPEISFVSSCGRLLIAPERKLVITKITHGVNNST